MKVRLIFNCLLVSVRFHDFTQSFDGLKSRLTVLLAIAAMLFIQLK